MPNLLLIRSLREKYFYGRDIKGFLPEVDDSPNYVRPEHLDFLIKHYTDGELIARAFKSRRGGEAKIGECFAKQTPTDVVIVHIVINDFLDKCMNLKGKHLSRYLENYYDKIIPIIYKHGGEIERIMGDSITCIFGLPFLRDYSDGLLFRADCCAKEIIVKLRATNKEVKISLHDGDIVYYLNQYLSMPEYTAVGKPLMELSRLETLSESNSINFFLQSSYNQHFTSRSGFVHINRKATWWERTLPKSITMGEKEDYQFQSLKCI
jgi:class 3 adenylate cyclase